MNRAYEAHCGSCGVGFQCGVHWATRKVYCQACLDEKKRLLNARRAERKRLARAANPPVSRRSFIDPAAVQRQALLRAAIVAATRPTASEFFEPAPAGQPTVELPGTRGKIAVLRKRAAAGEELFDPRDADCSGFTQGGLNDVGLGATA
jgi:hypothetical protein